jgi:hypothetical protein
MIAISILCALVIWLFRLDLDEAVREGRLRHRTMSPERVAK